MNPHVEILAGAQRLLRQVAHIGRISEPAEAKAECLAAPVDLPEGKRLDRTARPRQYAPSRRAHISWPSRIAG